ncbi:MAG: thioredoxin [Lachnospiraceae bacterium]|nr:thioredoxin [Lachnospiraceae bacterium]
MVKKITENEFKEVLAAKMALVDFSAVWCGPCRMVAPVLEEVSEEMNDSVAFFNIDVDENPNLAQKYGITSIPALVLMKEGKVLDLQVGFLPKAGIISYIKSKL